MTYTRTHRRRQLLASILLLIATVIGAVGAVPARAEPASPTAPLAEERIYVVGLELRPGPAHQVVPKNQGTSVAATLALPGAGASGASGAPGIPALPADAVVLGELTGPVFGAPVTLAAAPGGSFAIPPLALPGLYTLGNIRLVHNGQVVLLGNPAVVRIEVIDRVLVSQVTSRPLTADEIKERGIVIDERNFRVVNFTVAFGLQDQQVNIDLPMLLPSSNAGGLPGVPMHQLPGVGAMLPPEEGGLPELATRFQAPNLSIAGFSLEIDEPEERKIRGLAEPIPGVVIIPGNVAYLNQFFSVMLKVSNVAPGYSNLTVRDLKATIVLPPGQDNVGDSLDDPLRMAVVGAPPAPQNKQQPVIYPGPDGQFKTADDIDALAPQQSGDAEYLVEGVREGVHTVNLEITGMLHGLPDGPVKLKGRAVGMVEVRNPTFALTVNHPETVSAGEEYDLLVTLTNVSDRPANFAAVSLLPRSISGAELLSDATAQVTSIPPGDAATVTFRLRALKTGTVTSNSIAADGIPGKFELRTAVGELGIPLAPTSLVLPPAANGLPANLRLAGIALLNQAFALAGAPVTPAGLLPMGRNVVYDQGVSLAAAGQRITLGEPAADAARDLLLDFMGNNYARLDQRFRGARLSLAQNDLRGFDQLMRRSGRGAALRDVAAGLWGANIAATSALAFQQDFAEAVASRPAHLSVMIGSGAGTAPAVLALTDPAGRKLGVSPNPDRQGGQVLHDIPFGGFFQPRQDSNGAVQYALVATPDSGAWLAEIVGTGTGAGAGAVDVGLVFPTGAGASAGLRRVTFAAVPLAEGSRARVRFTAGAPGAVVLELDSDGDGVFESTRPATVDQPVTDRAPRVISSVQIMTGKKDGTKYAQVIGVLFSEEVDAVSAQSRVNDEIAITHYAVDANQVKNAQIQGDNRVVLLALNNPVGVYITRTLTVSNVQDLKGNLMQPLVQSAPIRTVATGARLSGVVRRADGTPVPFAGVLLSQLERDINDELYWEDVALQYTDAEGRYSFDRIRMMSARLRAVAMDTNEQNYIITNPRFEGQHIQVDVVLVGTGALTGKAVAADGVTPLAGARVRAASLTQYTDDGTPLQGVATTAADGSFLIGGLPVGPLAIQAVHGPSQRQTQVSAEIPTAGAVVTQTLVLLTPDQMTYGFGSVAGQVFRSDGVTPAANVPIYTSRGGFTMTNASGAYRFDLLPEGPVSLRAIDPAALEQADTRTTVVASDTVAANLVLFGGVGTVRGAVFEEDGTPAVDMPIYGGPAVVRTDATGQFVLENVPVGARQISAFDAARQRLVEKGITIRSAGDEAIVQLVMPARGVIAGRVLKADGRTPAANVRVIIFGADTYKVYTDSQGGYRAENLPMGDYTVAAFLDDAADGNIATGKLVYNNQVQQIDVIFKGRGAAVTGIVYDDDGVTPLGARVGLSELVVKWGKLTPPENPLCLGAIDLGGGQTLQLPPCENVPIGFEFKPRARRTNSNPASGLFTFTQPFVGPLLVEAANPFSPQEVSKESEMPRAGATVSVTLSLVSTGVVTGTVFRPDGSRAGEHVIVRFDSGYISDAAVRTDPQGNFSFPLVNPGGFRLTATDPISSFVGQSSGSVAIGATAYVPVRLLREGSVTVYVEGVNGLPLTDADVTVREHGFPNRVRTGNTKTGQITFAGGDSVAEGGFSVTVYDRVRGVYRTVSGVMPGVQASPAGQVEITVRVENAAGTVLGRFLRQSGVGIPNAQVRFNGPGGEFFTTTDSQGAFQFDGILVGAFQLHAEDPATGRRGAATGAITLDGQTVTISMTEQALGTVRGFVRRQPENLPVAGAQVRLAITGGGSRTVLTGPDGAYSFAATPVGAFDLFATSLLLPGIEARASGVLTSEGQIANADLNLIRPLVGQVQGRVFNADGTPLSAGTVVLRPQGKLDLQTTVTITGFYSFRNVPVAPFELVARPALGSTAGKAAGSISFDGDSETLDITLLGTGAVRGQVRDGANQPVGLAEVRLTRKSDGQPVAYDATTQADVAGYFTFTNVVVGDLSATARQLATGLAGAAAGALTSNGDVLTLTVTLQPAGVVSGTVRRADGSPAPLMGLELRSTGATYYGFTTQEGAFRFDNVKLGDYLLHVFDPQGQGMVDARAVITGQGQVVELNNLVLDTAPPEVVAVFPANGANAVPVNTTVVVTFSEALQAATVNGANLVVSTPAGPVTGTWTLDATGVAATFTPTLPFRDLTAVNLRVKRDIKDLVGRSLSEEYVSGFTTADTTAPAIVSRSPLSGALNVALTTPIRLTLGEAVNASAVISPALRVFQNGQPFTGTLTWLFDNTVLVFTPAANWSTNSTVRVEVAALPDRVGNTLPAGSFTFDTLDIIPPVIQAIDAPGGGTVIAGDTARIVADATDSDIDFVEFFVDGLSLAVDNSTPFEFTYPTPVEASGVISVTARAVDKAGNQSQPRAIALVIQNDAAPQATITTPLSGTVVDAGGRVTVTVAARDDRGLGEIVYQALGAASAAGRVVVTPAVTTRAADFVLRVPAGALPGERIELRASAVDTRGQASPVAVSYLRVGDATPPQVTIAAPVTGTEAVPGQTLTVTVVASDPGGVASLRLVAGGAAQLDKTQTITPAASPVTATFAVAIAANARPTATVTLVAHAVDATGNQQQTAAVVLPVRDQIAPTVQLAVSRADLLPGQVLRFVVTGTDEIAVAQVGYRIDGAFTATGSRAISPARASAGVEFTVTTPLSVTAGSVITVTGMAADSQGNQGAASPVTLTIVSDPPPVVQVVAVRGCVLAADNCDLRVATGAQFTVTVAATDADSAAAGVATLRLRSSGAINGVQSAVISLTQTAATAVFTLTAPAALTPSALITLTAEAVDGRGQVGSSAATVLTVVDLAPPAISIQSPAWWTELTPGAAFTVQTYAYDNIRVGGVAVTVTGALSATASQVLSPALAGVTSNFVFTLPLEATAADVVTLTVQAVDTAGNAAAPVVQQHRIKDIIAPAVVVSTNGVTAVLPLGQVQVTVTGIDAIGVAQLGLAVTGAYTTSFNQYFAVANTVTTTFDLRLPASVRPGSQLVLVGRATDGAYNAGFSQPLTLTVAQPTGALGGRVTRYGSGEAVPNAFLQIYADSGFLTTTADAAGYYLTQDAVFGATQVTAFDPVSGAQGQGYLDIQPDDLAPVIDVVISDFPGVTITQPLSGSIVIHGSTITVTVDATDDNWLETIELYSGEDYLGGAWAGDPAPYAFPVVVPGDVVSLTLHAVAYDGDGNRRYSAPLLLVAAPDPLTTVTGRVLNANGQPVAGVSVYATGDRTGVTALDGRFTITGTPTILGNVGVLARAAQDGLVLNARSAYTPPVAGGVTDLGDLTLGLGKVWDGGGGTDNWNTPANWSDDLLPTAEDDVYLPITATVRFAYFTTINSLRSDGQLTVASGQLALRQDGIVRNSLILQNGDLRANDAITVTGPFTWTGGTLGGPGRVVVAGALDVSGDSHFLEGAVLVNRGAATWRAGNFYLTDGAIFENAAGATLEISANANFWHYYNIGAAPRLRNLGVITKTTSSDLQVLTRFENSGVVNIMAGALLLDGVFDHTGALQVQDGATLRFTSSTVGALAAGSSVTGGGRVIFDNNGWSGKTVTVAGRYALTGVTQLLNGTAIVSPTASFSTGSLWLSSGRLESHTAITVTDVLTWTSSTLTGPGSTYVAQRIVLEAGSRLLDGQTLINGGQAQWAGTLRGANNAVWRNLPGATLDIPGDANTYYWDLGAQPAVINEGTLRKVAPGTPANVAGMITNTGVIEVISGTLNLPAGSMTTGLLRVNEGGVLNLNGGAHQVAAGGALSNTGQVILASGVLTVAGRYDAPGVTQANSGLLVVEAGAQVENLGSPLRLQGGTLDVAQDAAATARSLQLTSGALQGGGVITASETFTWTGGVQRGAGVTVIAGQGNIGPGGSMDLSSRRLAIAGAVTWLGGALRGNNGAVVYVQPGAVLSVTGDADFDHLASLGARPTLHVAGSLVVSAPVAANAGFDLRGDLLLDGAATLRSGAMLIYSNGVQRGALVVEQGAVLEMRSRYTTEVGSTITGLGTVRQNGGLSALAGDYQLAGVTEINNGMLTPATPATFAPANLQIVAPGVLSATGDITVTQVFTWVGGTLRGDGVTYVAGSANLVAGAPGADVNKHLLRRTLAVGNLGVWAAGDLRANDGATLRILPGASFDIKTGGTLSYFNNIGARPTLLVEGELVKSAGTESFVDFVLVNQGEVRAASGVLNLRAGGASQSIFTADAGGVLKFTANYSHTATSTLQGQGAILANSGVVEVEGAYAVAGATIVDSAGGLTLQPAALLTNLGSRVELLRGTLTLRSGEEVSVDTLIMGRSTAPVLHADHPLQVTGVMTWTDGTLQGAGSLQISAAARAWFGGGNKFLNAFRLENAGNLVWQAGALYANNGSRIANLPGGVFDLRTSSMLTYQGAIVPVLVNDGALLRLADTGVQDVYAAIENNGVLQVLTGTVRLQNSSVTSGTLAVGAGATVDLSGAAHRIAPGGAVQGEGRLRASNVVLVEGGYNVTGTTETGGTGRLTLAPTATITSLGGLVQLSGGELALNSGEPVTLTRLVIANNGALSGADAVTVTGVFTWSQGTLTGSGATHIAGAAVFESSNKLNNGRPLELAGVTQWTGGDLYLSDGAVLRNLAGATFVMATDNQLTYQRSTPPTVINEGVIVKAGGAGAKTLYGQWTNSGVVRLQSGTVWLQNSYTQTGGETVLEGGNLRNTNALQLQGGVLRGRGVIQGNVTNGATVAIEPLGSLLQVTGNYVQSGAGALVVGLQSTDPVTGFDRLQIGGQANLSGTLTVTRPTGYAPAAGATFPVVTFLARIGQFATIAGLDLDGGGQLTPVYNATNLTLQAPETGNGGQNVMALFDGAGMAYTVDCQATLTPRRTAGLLAEGRGTELLAAPALANLYALTVNGQPFPCAAPQASAAAAGTPLVFGPAAVDGITTQRTVQAAADGNYVRYIEELTNLGTAPRMVSVELASDLAFGAGTRILAGPAQTGLPYVVAAGDNADLPLIAQVFGGAGAGAILPEAAYADGSGRFGLRWPALTLAPGQTVRLVYFVLHAPAAEAAALDAQARGLATLTAGQVAAAQPAVDAASVVNFPPGAPAAPAAPRLYLPLVAGSVTMASGGEAPPPAPDMPDGASEQPLPAPAPQPAQEAAPDAAGTGLAPAVFLPLVSTE